MPSPFPGMDPYIEHPDIWLGFHQMLIAGMVEHLNEHLPAQYIAKPEQRTEIGYWDSADTRILYPDAAVLETARSPEPAGAGSHSISPATDIVIAPAAANPRVAFINITAQPENRLVTVIELLSPINKRSGNPAYNDYISKREDLLASRVHLLEIDLLRKGARFPAERPLPDAPYFAFLSRFTRRPYTEMWAIQLDEPLPTLPVPLLPDDADVPLPLDALLQQTYRRLRLDAEINYHEPPLDPLTDTQRAYINDLLAPLRQHDS